MSFVYRTSLWGVDDTNPNALVLTGRVTRADVPGLCAELEALLSVPGTTVVDCDVRGVTHPDLALAEAVARLALVARRAGGAVLRLRDAPGELRSLLDLLGLAEVLGHVRVDPP
ncbi:STAS domain-containing protein [Streptomyces sp. NBC_01754]|uniref:STAS domain-containing protein n=1 Tax=Streptomyces sp. NBC_01754 TaxID=2975930 RepID=UPI002DD8E96E|nr:STAS domain-containing protein [Streptomyces sp. NBC_01754]WSC94466.1 STAS domain-containing protein [Streptomyces sp. NBC_01754]